MSLIPRPLLPRILTRFGTDQVKMCFDTPNLISIRCEITEISGRLGLFHKAEGCLSIGFLRGTFVRQEATVYDLGS